MVGIVKPAVSIDPVLPCVLSLSRASTKSVTVTLLWFARSSARYCLFSFSPHLASTKSAGLLRVLEITLVMLFRRDDYLIPKNNYIGLRKLLLLRDLGKRGTVVGIMSMVTD